MHKTVKPKKSLGQHFLTDIGIAQKIANILQLETVDMVLEIGPGTGMMTKHLYTKWGERLQCMEIDTDSVAYLAQQDWSRNIVVHSGDFLKEGAEILHQSLHAAVIGNFPYNISTQIVFVVLEQVQQVSWFGGMFQKEVAKRLIAEPGNKEYGITSVLLQAYFDCKYIFTVNEGAFNPPPKVKSGVISCYRKNTLPDCEFNNLRLLVKTAFGQRRKTLSNALKPIMNLLPPLEEVFLKSRAEQIAVAEWVKLAGQMPGSRTN